MEAFGGEEVQLLLILDLGTRWGWVVSVTPRPRFYPRGKDPGTHCTGGWVGLRAGLDTEARRKILCPRRGSNPDRPVVQPVVRHYTAWANSAPYAIISSANCDICISRRVSSFLQIQNTVLVYTFVFPFTIWKNVSDLQRLFLFKGHAGDCIRMIGPFHCYRCQKFGHKTKFCKLIP
jgi:hypothetical protein